MAADSGIGSAVGGLAGIGIAGAGMSMSQDQYNHAMQQLQNSIAEYQAIGIPAIQAQQLALQDYKSAGTLTPEMEQAVSQGNTQLSGVQTDPQYKQAQLSALQSLQGIANHGGLTIADQANENNLLSQTQQANAGNQQAIMQNFAQRGMGGSGFELAQRLSNAQAAGNAANQQSTNIAAQAQARALQALSQGGQLAGGMQAQEYGQKANAAAAQDAINRFNTQNSQAVANQNTAYKNQAQQYNLQNAQNISNANTGLANYQDQYNKQLQQQYFNDQMQRQSGVANARNGVANQFNAQGQNTAATMGGIGQGVAQLGAAYDQSGKAKSSGGDGGAGQLSDEIDQYKIPEYDTSNFGGQ